MLDMSRITEWDYCKEIIRLCLRPEGKGRPQDITGSYLDMEAYLRIISGDYSAVVTSEMLRIWNISREEAIGRAMINTERDADIKTLYEAMKELMGDMFDIVPPEELKDYVIRTKDGIYGAAVIVCSKVLDKLAKKLDSDLLILPSSVHEIIVRPADITLVEASEMVKQINEQEVDPKERLSDHAYIYLKSEYRVIY